MTAAIVSIHVVTCLASLKMLYIKYFVAYGDWFWYPETLMQHLCISLYYLYILNNLPHLLWTETIQHISIDSQKQRSTVLGDDADQHLCALHVLGYCISRLHVLLIWHGHFTQKLNILAEIFNNHPCLECTKDIHRSISIAIIIRDNYHEVCHVPGSYYMVAYWLLTYH